MRCDTGFAMTYPVIEPIILSLLTSALITLFEEPVVAVFRPGLLQLFIIWEMPFLSLTDSVKALTRWDIFVDATVNDWNDTMQQI